MRIKEGHISFFFFRIFFWLVCHSKEHKVNHFVGCCAFLRWWRVMFPSNIRTFGYVLLHSFYAYPPSIRQCDTGLKSRAVCGAKAPITHVLQSTGDAQEQAKVRGAFLRHE